MASLRGRCRWDIGSEGWEFLEDETHKEDAPMDIVFTHPLGSDEIRIRNPEVLSRSVWYTEECLPRYGQYTHQNPGHSPLDMSTGSDASMAIARKWIDTCRHEHQNCGKTSAEAGHMPTRVLDVSQAMDRSGGIVTLVDSTHVSSAARTWNPSYNYFTTASNVDQHLAVGMQTSLLPKTFAEACVTVQRIGLRYIWIDSLCIVQDERF